MAASQAANPSSEEMCNTQASTSAILATVPGLVQSSSDVSVMTIETLTSDLDRYDHTPPGHATRQTQVDAFELNRASKRTSSGTVKGLVDSSADGAKEVIVTELSGQLKTRLKYAMVKIQNGWEKQSIEQLETLAAAHSPPALAPGMSRHSSSSSEAYLMSPIVRTTPPQRSSKLFRSHVRSSSTNSIPGRPSLAPAPQITPRTNHRPLAPPSLCRSDPVDDSPVTPSSRISSLLACNGILQNQAEKDAVDSLLFMSSPNNSKNMKYAQDPARPRRPKSPPDFIE